MWGFEQEYLFILVPKELILSLEFHDFVKWVNTQDVLMTNYEVMKNINYLSFDAYDYFIILKL